MSNPRENEINEYFQFQSDINVLIYNKGRKRALVVTIITGFFTMRVVY